MEIILLSQTVKCLVEFVIIGQTPAVDGATTLKSRTVELSTCMSCKKRLSVTFDTVVSVDISWIQTYTFRKHIGK